MDGLGEQNTALQMKPRSMVEEEVPAGEVAAQAQREIERLLQDNQKERAVLADRYKKKIDFLEEEIERLTDRGASDRLIEKKEREIFALIADYNRRVAPLLKRWSELKQQLELVERAPNMLLRAFLLLASVLGLIFHIIVLQM